ncbi:DUF1566 domain-containing protein [Thiocapsa sp.]|uniref:Lcl C-terminal domain-containing protein n=1 Tax=Thiocapsa sp. TaxID=2024551 RepID=UPI00359351C7
MPTPCPPPHLPPEAAVFAGSSLWRLPNKKELASLVEQRCYAPAINSRFFPNTPSSWFWSSLRDAGNSNYAWFVGFDNGSVDSNNKYNERYVRLVRGGQ